jgi:Mn2+/Fe2+ NRAMP family transporter
MVSAVAGAAAGAATGGILGSLTSAGGIATYSQVGAQFGYGLAWTLVFSYPLMAAIQEIRLIGGPASLHCTFRPSMRSGRSIGARC